MSNAVTLSDGVCPLVQEQPPEQLNACARGRLAVRRMLAHVGPLCYVASKYLGSSPSTSSTHVAPGQGLCKLNEGNATPIDFSCFVGLFGFLHSPLTRIKMTCVCTKTVSCSVVSVVTKHKHNKSQKTQREREYRGRMLWV